VPDALRPGQAPAGPSAPPAASPVAPAAPPVAPAGPEPAADGRPPHRPSWLRAALWSLIIVAAGVALGGAGYRLERTHLIQLPSVARTADGLVITAQPGHELSGLGLDGPRLVWQDGASIEYLDTTDGRVLLLGPGAGMRVTWEPAVSDRFAVWFEAERQASLAAQLVVYDTLTGRRRAFGDVGSVRSFPALSGDLAVWCSALQLGQPQILGARVGGGSRFLSIADGDGAPVVSGGLVVWAAGWTGPFYAEDVTSGTQWPVTASLTSGRLTGLALSGRTLVWGQQGKLGGSGVVAAADVDAGGQQTVASGATGLAGPSYDGTTVVWAASAGSGSKVLASRPGFGGSTTVATVDGHVTEVAVSGDSVAWIVHSGSGWSVVVRRLPQ